MGTFNDGDSGSSIRTKINTAIQKTEGTSAISTIDVDGGAIDGVTLGTNSAVTEAQVDNININGNTISSTDTNGDVTIDPNGTGDVNIGNFKFDADQTVGAGQDNYVLTYDNTGGKISLEAAAGGSGISNVVDDTTPQLGGDLDTNSNAIKFGDRSSSGVNELIFGAGDDLKIFHGTNNHSQIVEGGSGNLQIYASNLQLKSNAGADYLLATDGGSVELYHNSNKKFETTSSGVTVTGSVTETSDIRTKKNIETIKNALEKVSLLRGVTFNWNNDVEEKSTGVIGQDVEKVLPHAVRNNPETGYKSVAYGNMVGLLIEAIKEQQAQIDQLKSKLLA